MKGEPLGPLHGLPIGVKDVTPTAGIRTIFASPLFKDYVPTEPKRCAASRPPAPSCSPKQYAGIRLRRRHQQCAVRPDPQSVESGAQSGRFFRRLGGRRRQRVVQIAQGTDFGCSIRIPAAFSGIVGIRPTPGLTPSRPLHLPWDPGQVNGPLARRRRRAFP
jgi:amidase